MRRILLSTLVIGTLTATAAPLTPEAALEAALGQSPRAIAGATGQSRFELVFTAGDADAYVFRNQNGTFVVAAGDDTAASPLLGYGDGMENADPGNIPPAMAWLIDGLTTRPMRMSDEPVKRADIPVMVSARWNQDAPYNNDCPESRRAKTYTGCEATAAAQIMYYFKYPEKGIGEARYAWNSGSGAPKTLRFIYEDNPFDWDNMLDVYTEGEYTEEQGAAVANLMYGLGVGMKMQYGTTASGCYDVDGAECITRYFGYDKRLTLPMAEFYTVDEWASMVYDQLAQERPVLYTGTSEIGGGHAFVCDGYDGSKGDYFHINWGWGGSYDGYFLLTALTPEGQGIGGSIGGFTEGMSIFKDMFPDEGGEQGVLFYTLGSPSFSETSIPRDEDFTVYVDYTPGGELYPRDKGIYYFGVEDWTIDLWLRFTEVETGEVTEVFTGTNNQSLTFGEGVPNLPIYGSEFPEPGKYLMEVGYKNQGEWEPALGEPELRRELYVATTPYNIYFGVGEMPEVPADDSVDAIGGETIEGEPVYYDLQGRRVTAPESGIYIREVNGRRTKVVI